MIEINIQIQITYDYFHELKLIKIKDLNLKFDILCYLPSTLYIMCNRNNNSS